MLSLQRTLSFGYLAQHPTRMGLVVVSIALGVATLVATRTLNHSLNQAAKGAINPFAAMADLLVSNGQTGVPGDLADKLNDANLPGLAEAQPLVMGRAAVADGDRNVMLLGINWSADKTVSDDNPWGLRITRTVDPKDLLINPAEIVRLWHEKKVLVGAKLAESLRDLPEGTKHFKVRGAGGGEQSLSGVGTVHLEGLASILEENALFMDVSTAASLVYPDRPDYVTQVNLKVRPGADVEQVRRAVSAFLKDAREPAQVQTAEANEQQIRDVTAGLELGFSIESLYALVVGLYLVYIVLSVSVAERRHDIGILRSTGATRRQIALLFVGEAIVLGLAGSVLGLPLGYGLAVIALGPVRKAMSDVFVPLADTGVSLQPGIMLLAVAAGVTTALLAALVPALQAAEEQPADAVRRVPQTIRPIYTILQISAALLLGAAAVGCIALREYLPARTGSFGPVVCLALAAQVLIPFLSALIGRIVQPFFRYCLGLGGRLAADNIVRSPGRTGQVIGAVASTGALMVMTAGFVLSTQTAVNGWIDDSIAADLFVTAGSALSKSTLALSMDENVGDDLRGMKDKVAAALPVRFHYTSFHDQFIYLIAVDVDAFHGGADHAMARNLSRFPALARNEPGQPHTCVVSENFAALHRVGVGDRIALPGGTKNAFIDLEIIGTLVDYTWNHGTILVDRKWFSEEFADNQIDVYDVYLRPGVDAAAFREELLQKDGWAARRGVFIETREQLHAGIIDQLSRVYIISYAQQFIGGLVALLGVIISLSISVLQRRRELGLLRAVGASQGQVLWSVLAEAALMGLVGATIGCLVGLALEWYLVRFMLFDEAGFVFPMRVPWQSAGVVFALSVLLATLVGLWPAWHATRLRIPEAIAYE